MPDFCRYSISNTMSDAPNSFILRRISATMSRLQGHTPTSSMERSSMSMRSISSVLSTGRPARTSMSYKRYSMPSKKPQKARKPHTITTMKGTKRSILFLKKPFLPETALSISPFFAFFSFFSLLFFFFKTSSCISNLLFAPIPSIIFHKRIILKGSAPKIFLPRNIAFYRSIC